MISEGNTFSGATVYGANVVVVVVCGTSRRVQRAACVSYNVISRCPDWPHRTDRGSAVPSSAAWRTVDEPPPRNKTKNAACMQMIERNRIIGWARACGSAGRGRPVGQTRNPGFSSVDGGARPTNDCRLPAAVIIAALARTNAPPPSQRPGLLIRPDSRAWTAYVAGLSRAAISRRRPLSSRCQPGAKPLPL